MGRSLNFVVPGSLEQRTGGYIYDRWIIEGLRAVGWSVALHELAGRFPNVDAEAIEAASDVVRDLSGGTLVIDGLALPAFDGLLENVGRSWIGLIHHPLAMETGLSPSEVAAFAELESRLMRQASKLIVTSPMTRRNLAGFDIDPETVSVVTPGVEPASVAEGSGGDAPQALLSVGSLTKRKGHLVLLSALSKLTDLDWHLRLVGSAAWDPEHAREIKTALDGLGLVSRVALVGEQDDAGLNALYHQADLFVLASLHEGYGMVLSEALARGLPIISTTAGAIPETVPAVAGKLVAPGDVDALADALREVLTNRAVYSDLKKGALHVRDGLVDWTEATRLFALEIEMVRER